MHISLQGIFMKRLALTIFLTSLLAVALTGCNEKEMKDSCNENVPKGTRDGNSYRTVKIGFQTWMAENLNVKIKGSWCYKDKESNCQKYGRLYNWAAAKAACPAGWHLPSREEFKVLLEAVGGKDIAGKKLKSSIGWKKNSKGDDAFGFSALPAGLKYSIELGYDFEGRGAYFWSSTEASRDDAYRMQLRSLKDSAILYAFNKDIGSSVRCLKD